MLVFNKRNNTFILTNHSIFTVRVKCYAVFSRKFLLPNSSSIISKIPTLILSKHLSNGRILKILRLSHKNMIALKDKLDIIIITSISSMCEVVLILNFHWCCLQLWQLRSSKSLKFLSMHIHILLQSCSPGTFFWKHGQRDQSTIR